MGAQDKNALQDKITNFEDDIRNWQRQIKDLNAKIKRLEKASRELYSIKSDYKKTVKKPDTAIAKKYKYKWKGKKYNEFKRHSDSLVEIEGKYYKSIDSVHDKIIRKIADLKSKRNQLEGDIFRITRLLENARAEIKTITN